jgi:hypothetical protein
MPTTAKRPPAGKTLADFRSAHDKSYVVPHRIREALAKLGDSWEYDAGMLKLAQLSTTDLAAYRDQFRDHIVMTNGRNPKRVWCGTVKLAEQLREMV